MTVDYVENMHDKWLPLDHGEHTVEEIIEKLDAVHHYHVATAAYTVQTAQ